MSSKFRQDPLGMVAVLLAAALVLSLIPMLAISVYSRPAVDDYVHGAPAHDVYLETGSVIKTLVQGFKTMCSTYLTWQGSHTAILLSALQPGVFGEQMYFLSPVISILLHVFSHLYLFDAILYHVLGTNRRCAFCAGALMTLLTMQLLPDGAQGFYVHAYTCSYSWMYSLSLILAGLLAKASESNPSRKRYYLLCPLTAFFVAGCNYSTVLLVFLFLLGYCAILLFYKKRSTLPFLTLGVYALGFFVSVLAPGNGARMAIYGVDVHPIHAIIQAIIDTLQLVAEWTTFPFVMLQFAMLIFLLPVIKQLTEHFSFPLPLGSILIAYLFVAAGLTPLIYGYGEISTWAGRVFNLLFSMYGILFLLCLCYITGWALRQYQNKASDASSGSCPAGIFTRYIPCYMALCVVITLIFGHTGMQEEHYYHLQLSHIPAISATATLMNGDAKGFAEEMDARLPVLYDASQPSPRFAPLTHRPYLLLIQDIDSNPGSWVNVMWDQYYHKDGIALDS